MSFVSFRKAFFPTEEEIKAQEKMMEEIHNKCVEDRKNVKLVQDKKDPFLYHREPFWREPAPACRYLHRGLHSGT